MERAVLDKSRCGWWKSAVFYELYPKSFQDTTGSGTGDLRGILSHLDYLETLGVDAIWLCPICASPQVDNGYDISDFCAIEPSFGTMADMDELIAESKKRGIGILIDLTLNHCSDQHRWFRAAKSSRENPYHDYFLWRDGTPDCPPSGMRSVFGGSAWTYVPEIGQWYFHQFAPEQPDMNWENPKLRQELYDVMKFWVKKGVAGFRLDVIDQIAKEPDKDITINGPRLHEYLRGISENVLTDEGLVTVGEAWGADTERAKRYSAPDGSELSMVFQFEHIGLDQEPGKDKWDMIPLELPRLKECLRRWQQELYGCGWNSLFFNNHDLPRIVSRWGNDKEYRVESAKMLATMLYGLQGTPYIYQGEELGMTNIRLPLEQYQDLEIHNMYKERTERGDSPESVMQSIWARGPRQRPHPHAVDGRGERRFHHRHALAAREREPHRHQCRGCSGRPGFHLLLLQKAHCPAQGAAGLPGWAVHAAVPRGRAAVCLHPRHRNGAPAGGLQLLRARSFLRLPGGIPRRGVPCLQLQRTVCPDHSPL